CRLLSILTLVLAHSSAVSVGSTPCELRNIVASPVPHRSLISRLTALALTRGRSTELGCTALCIAYTFLHSATYPATPSARYLLRPPSVRCSLVALSSPLEAQLVSIAPASLQYVVGTADITAPFA